MTRFTGMYKQILGLHKSGSNSADLLKMAKQLYRTKSAKNIEFTFEHCWLLVKDYLKWVDGWDITNMTFSKRKARESDQVSEEGTLEFLSVAEGEGNVLEDVGNADSDSTLQDCPIGTKAAKDMQKLAKTREEALYAQAATTKVMATATMMRKAALLENNNTLLLMTTLETQLGTSDAHEYLRLWQIEELKKLQKMLANDEEQERHDEVHRIAAKAKALAKRLLKKML